MKQTNANLVVQTRARVATPAALVAMKLRAMQQRRGNAVNKSASDTTSIGFSLRTTPREVLLVNWQWHQTVLGNGASSEHAMRSTLTPAKLDSG